MRIKHSSITLILIQLFVFSAMVGSLSPTVSATTNNANTTTSNPDFPEIPGTEDVDFDWFNSADNLEPEFVPGEVLVKFRTRISVGLASGIMTTGIASIDELNERFEVKEITKVFSSVYKLTLPRDADVLSGAREYEADPNVEYAEPNRIMHTFLVPNDENYTQQWAHQMIESEYAWDTTTGDPSVVIAIVDTGVDWDHPDLAANIWINTDEIPDNDIDDDNNGFVDDIRGWDFVSVDPTEVYPGEDPGPRDNDTMDFHGHGTFCSGIVAAVTNNEIGIAGVTWNCKIMPVRAGYKNAEGKGQLENDDAAAAIVYAADNGADVISMSWGGYYVSKVVYDAVKYAYDCGVLLVAAAGNIRWSLKCYPAAHEEVVAIAATDQNDNPADWLDLGGVDYGSAFGDWIELAAPGDEIYSTLPNNDYDYANGTSMACPHVAGVAALIWSQFPNIGRDAVRYQLRKTADDKGDPGFDIYYGYGRINVRKAVEQTPPDHDLLVLSWKLPFVAAPGDLVTVNTTVLNFGTSDESNITVILLANGTEVDRTGIDFLESGASVTVSCSWTPTAEGTYNVTTYVEPPDYTSTWQVGADTDDACEGGDGTFVLSSPAISVWQNEDPTWSTYACGGFRFPNVTIPQGSTVSSATFSGKTGISTSYDDMHCKIYGNDVDNAEDFSDNAHIISTTFRPRTSAYVSWDQDDMGSGWQTKTGLEHIVEEIVGRSGWSSGNAIVLLFIANVGEYKKCNFFSYGGGLNAAKLKVTFSGVEPVENNAQSAYTRVKYERAVKVHEDFATIGGAIIATNLAIYYGDATIWVSSGTYYEHDLIIQNSLTSLTLTGEDRSTTIIDSEGQGDASVWVHADNVAITGLTIQNISDAGIRLLGANNSTITDNTILEGSVEATYGIYVDSTSSNTVISYNTISKDSAYSGTTYGIYLSSSSGQLISNNDVLYSTYGIFLYSYCYDNTISANTISDAFEGIYLDVDSYDNTISANTISNNGRGVKFSWSDNNTIVENTIQNNGMGMWLIGSSNNVIYHNSFIDNTVQTELTGSPNNVWDNDYPSGGNYWSDYADVDQYSGPYQNETGGDGIWDHPYTIDANNKDNYPLMKTWKLIENVDTGLTYSTIQEAVDAASAGHTIKVYVGTYYEHVVVNKFLTLKGIHPSTTIIDGGGGGISGEDVVTIELENATISGFTIQNGRYGIYLYLCVLGSTISGNTISNNWIGVNLDTYSENCIIRNNFVSNCDFAGIYLVQADDNTITGNTVSNANIQILGSEGNTVSDNVLSNSGVFLYSSTDNTITGNAVSNSTYGVYIKYYGGNNVSGNTLSNNNYGVYLDTSSNNNSIYHNNFIDNTVQAASPGGTNVWDDGYSSGGNYWSDYTGEDQNLDGIGDTPYVIDANNQDNYPLMNPWPVHDVAVVDVTATLTEVFSDESVSIIVTVRNQGTESETFNVTVYYDSNAIGTQTVTDFAARDSTMLNFTWNTTCVALGTYTIKAVASTVPGETDTDDNTKIDGTVTIWAWNLLDEPWNQLDGWTKEGKGQSGIEMFDGKSCLYNKPDRSKYVTQRKDIGSLPETGYTVETSLYINSWGTGGSEAFVAFKFYDGMHLITIEIHSDRVVGPQNQFSLQTQIQQWYTWRFVIDSDADTIYAYRDEQYVGTLTGLTDSTANDGLVYCSWTQNPKGSSGCESYTDYIKIATGLYTPS